MRGRRCRRHERHRLRAELAGRPQSSLALSESISASDAEWRFYGRTSAGDRFAPQTQITPQNVSRTARSGDSADEPERRFEREFHSEATPLKIGDTLYTCTPHLAQRDDNPYLVCRGVAYYEVPGSECPRRIYSPIFDAPSSRSMWTKVRRAPASATRATST